MNVIYMLDAQRGPEVLLWSGEGHKDLKVARGIAHALNGDSCEVASPGNPLSIKRTKLAALGSVKDLLSQSTAARVRAVVLLVDGDAFTRDPRSDLMEALKKYGMSADGELEEIIAWRAYRLHVRSGSHYFTLYVAISGERKEIEEDEDRLKEIVGARDRKEALKKANAKHLEGAFPGIYKVLEFVKNNCRSVDGSSRRHWSFRFICPSSASIPRATILIW